MEIKISAFIFVLLYYTVKCSGPVDSEEYGDPNIQNDEYVNYDENEEPMEESKMPDVPLQVTSVGQEFIRDIGESVTLPCAISGSNYVQVWRKKDNLKDVILFQSGVTMAGTENMKLSTDGSLEISNLHVQDAGEYECIAMGSKQNSPTIQHKVILRVPPQIEFLMAKDNRTILKHGDALILTCKANGYPKPVISWHKGSSRFNMEGEMLTVERVKHHDAGTYTCFADNKIGAPAFRSIDIKVEHPPVITVEKISVSSENNSETELECLVHSEPKSVVVWTKDGLNIVENERIRLSIDGHKHNLVLKNIQDSDFGVYTCTATNALGTAKKDIRLVSTPAVYRFSKTQSDTKDVLTWEVQSKSNLSAFSFSYRKKGENKWKKVQPEFKSEVSANEPDIYEVKYVFSRGLDPGEYETKFRAENHKGWSEEFMENMSVEVVAKHGHHKSHNKKGHNHKHGKERQITPTPTSLPDVPAEHQEGEKQTDLIEESASKVSDYSAASSITTSLPLMSLALYIFLQDALSIRI